MSGRFAAVILDVDGTLVDSNDAHAVAYTRAMREAGFEIEQQKVRRLIGMGSDKLLPSAIGVEKDSPQGSRIADRKKEILKDEHLANLQPCRGARQLVQALRDRGIDMIVASSAGDDELKDLLQAAQVDDLIDQHTSSSDAEQSKPDAAIVQAAIDQLGVKANEALMIGDTPYDVEAATGAGVAIIAVRCGGWDDASLAGAIAVYDDPAELLAHLHEYFEMSNA